MPWAGAAIEAATAIPAGDRDAVPGRATSPRSTPAQVTATSHQAGVPSAEKSAREAGCGPAGCGRDREEEGVGADAPRAGPRPRPCAEGAAPGPKGPRLVRGGPEP